MSSALSEKDKVEIVNPWMPWDRMRTVRCKRFWNHPGRLHQALAVCISIFWLVFVPVDAAGRTEVDELQISLPPGVGVEVKPLPETVTVGDPVQIDLDITAPAGYQVKISEPEPQTGDFTILDFFPGAAVPEPGKQQEPTSGEKLQHYRARIVAAVYKTGKFPFPPIPIKLQTPDGNEINLTSPSLNIEVQSVLVEKNPKLKDLKRQAEIPERVNWLLWIIVALAVCIVGAVILYYWKKSRRHSVSHSPEEIRELLDIAEADLRELLSRGLPEDGMVKRFYVLLSQIVKRILESGFEIHTAEQTTSEIMNSLSNRPNLEPESRDQVESFLIRCDAVKFAKYVPSMAEHEAVSKDALEILAQAKKAAGSRQSAVGSAQ